MKHESFGWGGVWSPGVAVCRGGSIPAAIPAAVTAPIATVGPRKVDALLFLFGRGRRQRAAADPSTWLGRRLAAGRVTAGLGRGPLQIAVAAPSPWRRIAPPAVSVPLRIFTPPSISVIVVSPSSITTFEHPVGLRQFAVVNPVAGFVAQPANVSWVWPVPEPVPPITTVAHVAPVPPPAVVAAHRPVVAPPAAPVVVAPRVLLLSIGV